MFTGKESLKLEFSFVTCCYISGQRDHDSRIWRHLKSSGTALSRPPLSASSFQRGVYWQANLLRPAVACVGYYLLLRSVLRWKTRPASVHIYWFLKLPNTWCLRCFCHPVAQHKNQSIVQQVLMAWECQQNKTNTCNIFVKDTSVNTCKHLYCSVTWIW